MISRPRPTREEGAILPAVHWLPPSTPRPFRSKRSLRPAARTRAFRPALELLEDRTVPALFTHAPESPFGTGGNQPQLPAVADFNGDGFADLAIADRAQNSVTIFLGDGDGTFTSKGTLPATGDTGPIGMAVGLFDDDAVPDLAVTFDCQDPDPEREDSTVVIFRGVGDGTFTLMPGGAFSSGGKESTSIAVGDLNSDGKADLAVTNTTDDAGVVSIVAVFLGNGDGTFAPAPGSPIAVGSAGVEAVVVGDVDGNSVPDLAIVTLDKVTILLGNGDGTFAATADSPFSSGGMFPESLAFGHFNDDDNLDFVVVHSANNKVAVFLGNGDGTFAAQTPFDSGGSGTSGVTVTDFNDDGKDDLAIIALGGGVVQAIVLLGSGNGTFTQADGSPFIILGASSDRFIAIGDFDGNGAPDLVVTNAPGSGGQASVLLNTRGTKTTLTSTANPSSSGQAVVFTATVTAQNGNPAVGFVSFFASDTLLGASVLSGGLAVFSTTALAPGDHDITAVFNRNAFHNSSSAELVQQVDPPIITRGTQTMLESSASPSTAGQAVVFTATVTAENGSPAVGFVSFFDGDTLLDVSVLSSGLAVFGTSTLTPGDHDITAVFHANAAYDTSSAALVQQINPPFGTVSVQPDPLLLGARDLVIHGTQGDDVITVTRGGRARTRFLVSINGGAAQPVFGINGRIVIFGHEGDDTITLAASVTASSRLDGGAGDDGLTGGAGKDFLTGGLGRDTLNGRTGVDRLVESGDFDMTLTQGTAWLNGSLTTNGLGNDVLFRNSIEQAHLTGGSSANTLDASLFKGNVLLFGLGGDDVLTGGTRNDVLVGGEGDDSLNGFGGRDLLIGSLGVDALNGGAGDDLLIGGSTNHETSVAALEAIMLEWASASVYATRVAHLLGTKPGSKSGAVRLSSTTVVDDGLANALTGGLHRDWFFSGVADLIGDLNYGGIETVSTLP
jgi:Ca2+-binding RTX toxin-like protein